MTNKRTCLYDRHVESGALMTPFAGFDMPIQYTGIIEEHNAVREHCGVFDVSHMGEVIVSGPDADRYINHIFTNDVTGLPAGKVLYGMLCYPDGGVVDDTCICKLDERLYLMTINAANIDKDYAWIEKQAKAFKVKTENQSDYYGQLAVQGPDAERIVEEVLGLKCSELVFYTFKKVDVEGETIILSRTGYTGEDGFEIYGSHSFTQRQWDKLMEHEVKPCGLGCRDTLRFEVGLPLYGDELTDELTPLEAGLGFFAKLDKENFIGKDALVKQKTEGLTRKVVGIELKDKAIPRHGYEIVADGKVVGYVTTGYNSISTGKSVCMALVDIDFAKLGTEVGVQIRKKVFPGVVVKKKFYEKSYKQ